MNILWAFKENVNENEYILKLDIELANLNQILMNITELDKGFSENEDTKQMLFISLN